MVQTQLSDQVGFRSVLPEHIDWKPFSSFPPSARLAVVVGDPSQPGPYTIRVKLPSGVKLMPCQGSRELPRCDHGFSPPVIAGRSARIASRWARMR